MPKGARKGIFADGKRPRESAPVTSEIVSRDPTTITIVSGKGAGISEIGEVSLKQYVKCNLVYSNSEKIMLNYVGDVSYKSALSKIKQISGVVTYIDWYRGKFEMPYIDFQCINLHFCYSIVNFLEISGLHEATKARRLIVFRKLMKAIGVSESILPQNPYSVRAPIPTERNLLSRDQLKRVLKQAKFEAEIVRRRSHEALHLRNIGRDPRRAEGGKKGDWLRPECRYWIVENAIGLELCTFNDIRFTRGMHAELRGLEGKPGAEIVATEGDEARRAVGWKGHLRWFFPWCDDMMPFLTLFLLRTGANLSSAATLRVGEWEGQSPFSIGEELQDTQAFIKLLKVRGRPNTRNSGKAILIPSPKRPWSYPYRVLKFVEQLTAPLRREVKKRIRYLKTQKGLSNDERRELKRLNVIQNDLFLYKIEREVTSLAWATRGGNMPKYIGQFFNRCGLKLTTRHLRDAPIVFSFQASGHNIFVAQLLASHVKGDTTALYVRRDRILQVVEKQAESIFELSLDTIRLGDNISVKHLRKALREQGLSDIAISNLSDAHNVSRWGNRCLDPADPPREFGTPGPLGICTKQDCIDGCPNARWFRDSIHHVATELILAEQRRDSAGLETSLSSTIGSRISRCKSLLSRWPESEVQHALATARETSATAQSGQPTGSEHA